MRWLLLIFLVSCGSLDLRGLDSFGAVRKINIKKVNTGLDGVMFDQVLTISYVANNYKSCFHPRFKPNGRIYTVAYEHYEILMFNLMDKEQTWRFGPHPRFRKRIALIPADAKEVRKSHCSVKYLFMNSFFDKKFVSFVKED
jgi:hypothetical protein